MNEDLDSSRIYLHHSSAWAGTIHDLTTAPFLYVVSPRGQAVHEWPRPYTFEVVEPMRLPLVGSTRIFRQAIGVAEGLSLVGQVSIPEVLIDRVSAFRAFYQHSVFWGAYGPRAAGSIGQVVDLLTRDPDSRQAVVTLYDAKRDLGRPEVLDVPCTLNLHFLLRHGRLNLWVMMRSNDAWLGLPYDQVQFTMLQVAVAQALGVEVGRYTHSAGSMHLYDRDLGKAQDEVTAMQAGLPEVPGFGGPWWGADDIGGIGSRARRLLLGDPSKIRPMTDFESWCFDALWG